MFRDTIQRTMEKNVPHKFLKGHRDLPWWNNHLRKLCRRKKRARIKAKRTKKHRDWKRYRDLQRQFKCDNIKAHNEYITSIFTPENGEKLSKKTWSYLKHKRKDSFCIPTLYKDDDASVTSKQKAETLSEQYKSVFTEEDTSTMPEKSDPLPTMPDITVTVPGVIKLMEKLNPSKAIGPDEISTRILKDHREILGPVLAKIFQKSLTGGGIPADWRNANIVPIFKKGNKHSPSNYRPVSLTSVSCKMLEHIIFSQIMNHFDLHKFLVHYQHGFRRKHSCESQLVITVDDLQRGLDMGHQQDVLILDFSKAFDKVPHHRLLSKLDHCGIRGHLHDWLRDWLTTRQQTVVVDGERSSGVHVESGVPQGTVLGPLMFLLYINDIGERIDGDTRIRLFADDCVLYRSIHSIADSHQLQQDLNSLINWSHDWQMSFNASKCSVLRVSRKLHPISAQYSIDGVQLGEVKEHPYLGVQLSCDMSWSCHIESATTKATRVLNMLRRNLGHKAPQSARETAYKGLVRPHMEYASSVWDPYLEKDITRLEKVQNRAARYVTRNYDWQASVTSMKQELEWPRLQERRFVARHTLFYKALHEQVALPVPSPVTNIRQRTSHAHVMPLIRSNHNNYMFSFYPRTVRVWNLLPVQVVTAKSADHFRSSMWKSITSGQLQVVVPPRSLGTTAELLFPACF